MQDNQQSIVLTNLGVPSNRWLIVNVDQLGRSSLWGTICWRWRWILVLHRLLSRRLWSNQLRFDPRTAAPRPHGSRRQQSRSALGRQFEYCLSQPDPLCWSPGPDSLPDCWTRLRAVRFSADSPWLHRRHVECHRWLRRLAGAQPPKKSYQLNAKWNWSCETLFKNGWASSIRGRLTFESP